MRVQYAIAGGVTAVWLVLFSLVSRDWDTLLQLAGIGVGTVIFAAIGWPDDFKRTPKTHRDEPPAP